jgi:diguanylate cyclase (GGDEF)-like protein/putative nucleotidyltransferase with HDIG domain
VNKLSKNVRIGAALYAAAGVWTCISNLSHASPHDFTQFLIYLLCANIAALGLRLAVADRGLISAGFLVLLLAVTDLSLPEVLFIGVTVTLLRELQSVKRLPDLVPLLYAIATVTIGIAASQYTYHMVSEMKYPPLFPAPVIASSFVLLFNFGLATTLLGDPNLPFLGVYRRECRPLLPWFVAAAYLAYLVRSTSSHTHLHAGLIALPILVALDRGFRAWSDAKAQHREELDAMYQRTLETLALAIDVRDHTTHMHLRRVQFYARAVGREMGLNETQLQDLNVAALLHDIGKLGIPDHILLKPGTLSEQEWEKMKTHPMTGAAMLARMKFPQAVLAIVETHHEKWDGSGYPRGISGDNIPIGARILSAVDCLDALASDRPYRQALPLENAMARVVKEKGKSFDPAVVSILERRYVELERQACQEAGSAAEAPAAEGQTTLQKDLGKLGTRLLAESGAPVDSVLDPIVAARQETQLLQALAADLAHALGAAEVASAVHKCLSQTIRYDTVALYVVRGDQLEPVATVGKSAQHFGKEAVPLANGLSGRAARHRTSILNADPCDEPFYVSDSAVFFGLQAAMAVPLSGREGVSGVLTLYHADRYAFSRDDLRLAEAAGSHIGLAIENALRYQDTEKLAGTDHLTGIPNARALSLHLERELSRASREKASIGVLVCDLDGFKQVNDHLGHMTGNEVLQRVAKGLQEVCRSSDYLARMGGDEFVIVVPGLKEDQAPSYAARLHSVALEAGQSVGVEHDLSMSVGVAIYPQDGQNMQSLLDEADRRMYTEKQHNASSGAVSSGG